jgi:hypothetical protein
MNPELAFPVPWAAVEPAPLLAPLFAPAPPFAPVPAGAAAPLFWPLPLDPPEEASLP